MEPNPWFFLMFIESYTLSYQVVVGLYSCLIKYFFKITLAIIQRKIEQGLKDTSIEIKIRHKLF